MRVKLPMMCMLFPMMLSTSGCAVTTPNANMCAMIGKDMPDEGFEKRWTRLEKEYAETLNEILEKNCR